MGFLSGPHHFLIDHSGEIFDGRDSRARGSYFQDSIDILCLSNGHSPTAKQEQEIDYLVEALQRDYANTLEVLEVSPQGPEDRPDA